MEQNMLSKDAFIEFILKGSQSDTAVAAKPEETALPEGIEDFGFDTDAPTASVDEAHSSFARRLLEASGFGYAKLVQRDSVIRSSDVVARYLPTRAAYWPKTAARPYQTVLFEADLNDRDLKAIPAFRHQKMFHLDIVEDALSRLVEDALNGFQQGGQGVTADIRQGRREETLCVISILDERDGKPVRLVCFGTHNQQTGGLETFRITEQTRLREPQIAREHLGLLYERQFKKLTGPHWQEAFTTTEERKQAERLLVICTGATTERDIQEGILTLLDTIAKGFGLRRRPGQQRRLQAFALPSDHDIGIDPEKRQALHGGCNPFGAVALRDERNLLLGYIVYPLKTQADAERLRTYLRQNNRFHNVLVVYPGTAQAELELWQGQEQLTGKLRKGQGYRDAAEVVNLLSRFFVVSKAKVRDLEGLAQELAYRARYLRRMAVKQLEEEPEAGHLRDLYNAFKEALVHDQTEDEFADAYAQTLTYGLLSARWVSKDGYMASGERFTRESALKHMPATSPFLCEFFETVLKASFEFKLTWLLDDIAALLDRLDIDMIFNQGRQEADWMTDPVIYFYEPFLQAYDARIRKARGVYYTPRPVVSFIVRSVDELLRTEFGLVDGLADTTTWGEMVKQHEDLKIPDVVKPEDVFVQILDPAMGTGTFLVEVIDLIHQTMTEKWKGQWHDGAKNIGQLWNDYVPRHLLTRLYGYELLMAPYAIAHMKIGLKLYETGYRFVRKDRARVYLTNALELPQDFSDRFAFDAPALAHEAQSVNAVKRGQRFTVVIGNPPYAGISANHGEWITSLIDLYRFVDGQPLEEKKVWLKNDYVKFLRLCQLTIENSGLGIIGLITDHSYLDSPTFRGLRNSLLRNFPQAWLLNLHGNSKRRETNPAGGSDENVFDITQGVAIGLFVRHLLQDQQCIHYADLWGDRSRKYLKLAGSSASKTSWVAIPTKPKFYLFTPVTEASAEEYESGWLITDVFLLGSNGVQTSRDSLVLAPSWKELTDRFAWIRSNTVADAEICRAYEIADKSFWRLQDARKALREDKDWKDHIVGYAYRPFDNCWLYASPNFVHRLRRQVMQHMKQPNMALSVGRAGLVVEGKWNLVFCTKTICDHNLFYRGSSLNSPLYRYHEADGLLTRTQSGAQVRSHNIGHQFSLELALCLGLNFNPDLNLADGLKPEDIFHYTYAVFHSPGYRNRYAGFLKIDFPRLPLTSSLNLFCSLAELGGELVALHIMESPRLDEHITTVVGSGKFQVERASYANETVWLDKARSHGFQGIPEEVWNFHIGGYQVCEKWLKDRQAKGGRNPRPGRILTDEDITHYQKIVVALNETIRIMQEIDDVIDQHGGWPDAFVTKDGDNA